MTAYGALISLADTILKCYPNETILEAAFKELHPFQEILERLDGSSKSKCRKKVNALDGRIKQRLWDFEDLLESLLSDAMNRGRILYESSLPQIHPLRKLQEDALSTHFPQIRDAEDSFIQELKDMMEEYIYELDNMPEDEDEDDDVDEDEDEDVDEEDKDEDEGEDDEEDKDEEDEDEDEDADEDNEDEDKEDEDENEDEASISSSSTGTSDGMNNYSKMIGLSDEFKDVKFNIYKGYRIYKITSYAIVGMAGLGKTALARKIYQDPEIRSYFDCRIWIRVGRKYNSNQAVSIVARTQCGKRCLVVLDDVWDTGLLPIFLASLMEVKDGRFIRILITARGQNVTRDFQESMELVETYIDLETTKLLRLLDDEESKDLLCTKVFGKQDICPDNLEKAATKIAKNCEGLPLMILTVAKRLSNNRDPHYWDEVAQERNSVFTDSYEEISKVLFPSYDYLPQHFKMPFLYLGVFPRDYDIPMSKILNLLAAGGWLLRPRKRQSLKDLATEYLEELCISYNLVLFKQKSTDWIQTDSSDMLKTCRLHSSWRHLCRREARKNKFFHVLNRLVDASSYSHPPQQQQQDPVIKGQRGLCLENNLLFGLKDFCNSVKSHCVSSVRSLLFVGPYHQYPTPLIGFKLLRELDALQLRFYTFPTQILTLFQLKYLALTCNDQLPPTISKLFKLQTLIIHPHLSIIKCHKHPSFIPIEIWDMARLEHIEIAGKRLRASNHSKPSLTKLSTLAGVNADIGTISELLKRTPFLNKLGVQMEMAPYANTSDGPYLILSCFNIIATLGSLEILKCNIMNPVHVPLAKCPVAIPRLLMLPSSLVKIHLSGMGFPWEYMTGVIASLPHLQVLKLRCHAFRGPKWEIQEGSFLKLQYLAIEDSDLVEWKPPSGSFHELYYLSLKHCYKLRELDWSPDFGYVKIELVECNPLAVACARQLPLKHKKHMEILASDSYQA